MSCEWVLLQRKRIVSRTVSPGILKRFSARAHENPAASGENIGEEIAREREIDGVPGDQISSAYENLP